MTAVTSRWHTVLRLSLLTAFAVLTSTSAAWAQQASSIAGVVRDTAQIEKEIVDLVRERIGPVAAFKTALTVPRLPKTRSGKILRGTIKKIVDGESYKMPATVEDPAAFQEIQTALEGRRNTALTS